MSRKDNERALAALDAIDNYNATVKNINDQGSLLLATFQDPKGQDTSPRLKALFCANRIMDSLKELYYLNGTKDNKDVSKWLETNDYYLINYVPSSVEKIVGSDGTEYPYLAKDFIMMHKPLKYFGGRRGNHLQVFDGFYYDDTYIMQRTVTSFDKKRSDGKLEDFSTREWESSVIPMIPKTFQEVIDHNSIKDNAIKYIETIMYLDTEKMSLPTWLAEEKSFDDIKNPFVIHNENFTEDFAKEAMANAPEVVYYSNGTKYFITKLRSKRIVKANPQIKPEYSTYYSSASNTTRHYVYNAYECYKNYNYSTELIYDIVETDLTESEHSLKLKPGINLNETERCKIIDILRKNLLEWLEKSYKYYDSADKSSRCEDGFPSTSYPRIIDHLKELPLLTNSHCNNFISFVSNDVYLFVQRRCSYLYSTITDEDNDKKLRSLMLKRLTKNTGTLLLWYQSLLQFDDAYGDIDIMRTLALNATTKTLVVKAYYDNTGEAALFNTQDYPDYIDITDKDYLYTQDQEFKVDDTIYILDSGKNEQVNSIKGKSITYVKSTDYSNIEVGGFNEDIKGVVEKTIPVVRLFLKNRLPKWCKVEDPSNILIMKKVK